MSEGVGAGDVTLPGENEEAGSQPAGARLVASKTEASAHFAIIPCKSAPQL
ncbi:hypothetical protein MSA03_14680 [Microbacterium saccharophilum]|nr:hypothetical protein MSA03_14680 [Microbacterium saccharophilum]